MKTLGAHGKYFRQRRAVAAAVLSGICSRAFVTGDGGRLHYLRAGKLDCFVDENECAVSVAKSCR